LNDNVTVAAGKTLTVGTGATTLGGTLAVTGVSTLNDNVTVAAGKTLTVGTGATTLGGTLAVTGTTTLSSATVNGKVIVGASSEASSSAVLEASSTTQGFLPPRMTEAQRNAISSAAAGLVVWCSDCGSNGELQVHNGTTWKNMIGATAAVPPSYAIGQAALGGKIAYILQSWDYGYDPNVQHGLVATVADISTSAQWGCHGTTISGADGTHTGAGNQNTIDIMNGCATAGIAARLCGDLVEGVYSDWYLPSKDELFKLYLNRVAIGGFSNGGFYWSSSEKAYDEAWVKSFGADDYSQAGEWKNQALHSVRAIRAF
jgi:hypothetical protein